jgi:hypothetical protein
VSGEGLGPLSFKFVDPSNRPRECCDSPDGCRAGGRGEVRLPVSQVYMLLHCRYSTSYVVEFQCSLFYIELNVLINVLYFGRTNC